MEEFWVCQHCRSLNRASAGKCYGCREKYGSQPKQGTPAVKGANRVAAPPAALPTLADFGAAVVRQPYISRPVALPSPAAPSSAVFGTPAAREARGVPNPVSAVKRRIAWFFAQRQSLSVGWLGNLTAILLVLLVLDGAALVLTVSPAARDLLQNANLAGAWAHLTSDQQGLARTLAIAFGALGIVSLLSLSLFLGLTTHNATGLGADMPILTPYGAGIVWPVVVWTQARIAVGMIVPAALIWLGYPIPGLMAAIVAVEIAQRHLDDPFGWLTMPYRHLPDLYAKLGVGGSIESRLASLWSACFRAANVLAIAMYALPALAVILVFASDTLGRDRIPGWQSSGLGPAQLGVALLVGSLVAWTAGAVGLLVPITVGLVRRQRTRKTLVRVGRSRSWVARPGEGGYTPAQQPTSLLDDPLDRVIEHYPRYDAGGDAPLEPVWGQGFGPIGGQDAGAIGGQDFGLSEDESFGSGQDESFGSGQDESFGSGQDQSFGLIGGQGPSPIEGQGAEGPDQASLNSPSTTSSFPWSGEPPSPED
ncbi:MAG TPA: hypothetical protein VJ258_05710 [Candidatus Limnocylindrales bacterium]|nr:hypothetical protein [Candidatus Limnocylindrales bacterium]